MNTEFKKGFALLIGVDASKNDSGLNLPFVKTDILKLEEVLLDPNRGGYERKNIKTYLGEDSTKSNIIAGLSWLKKQIDAHPEATAIIYYSGHGYQDNRVSPPRYMFLPYDVDYDEEDEDILLASAVEASVFANKIEKINPDRLLVLLDCCHAKGMKVKGIREFKRKSANPNLFFNGEDAETVVFQKKGLTVNETGEVGKGRVVVNSCREDESSYPYKNEEISLFTFHLIKALSGHASPKDGEKVVLVTELLSYLYRAVPRDAQKFWEVNQHPDATVHLGTIFPVAKLMGGKGWQKGIDTPIADKDIFAAAKNSYYKSNQVKIKGDRNIVIQDTSDSSINIDTGKKIDTKGGDYIGGDKIGGDKITVGNISGGKGIAIGRNAKVHIDQNSGTDALNKLFQDVLDQIKHRPESQEISQEELISINTRIKEEVEKGSDANEPKINRWLGSLKEVAPDILKSIVKGLISPIEGISEGVAAVARAFL